MLKRSVYLYWFLSLAIAAALLLPALVPAQMTQMTGKREIPTQMSGKVVMEDGTPPPEPVVIEADCGSGILVRHAGNSPTPVGRTDSKGGFVIRLQNETNVMDARQTSSNSNRASGSASAAPAALPVGCTVHARLAGYRSSTLTVVNAASIDLGTIILYPTANVEGTTVSATTQAAPKDARKALEKARKAIGKRKLDEALPQLESATKAYPQFAEAWFELGRVQQASGNVPHARQAYEQAMAADPKFILPYLQMAALLRQEKNWKGVADMTATVIKLDPYMFPAAYVYNAESQFRLGNAEAAEASARTAVKLDTGHTLPMAEYTLGIILGARGDYKGAVEHLETYLKLFPNSPAAEGIKKQLAEFQQAAGSQPSK